MNKKNKDDIKTGQDFLLKRYPIYNHISKDDTYLKYFIDRINEGYDKEDTFKVINAICMKAYFDDLLSQVEFEKFCCFWNKYGSWKNKKDTFIYKYWNDLKENKENKIKTSRQSKYTKKDEIATIITLSFK